MTETGTATLRERPELFEDDNERIWAVGHHDATAMRVALALLAVRDWGADDNEAFDWAVDALVEQVWFRGAEDPTNDELMVRCEPTDEGAEPFTQIDGGWR